MNTELSPRIRTLVSGLAAVAMTSLLMTSLIESLNPAALTKRSVESSAQLSATTVDTASHAAFIRKV